MQEQVLENPKSSKIGVHVYRFSCVQFFRTMVKNFWKCVLST